MFTGIIQDVGTVTDISKSDDIVTFTVESKKISPQLKIGDSICVDGTCLTVTKKGEISFQVQAIPETLQRSISKNYTKGSKINLEPSMQIGDRFHGHMVTGHVDFVGKIVSAEKKGETAALIVEFPSGFGKYFAVKGSVTVNGVSLTITKLNAGDFEVQIIPHTQKATNLAVKHPSENPREVNVEIDLIARYLESLVNAKEDESNYFFLKERGFI